MSHQLMVGSHVAHNCPAHAHVDIRSNRAARKLCTNMFEEQQEYIKHRQHASSSTGLCTGMTHYVHTTVEAHYSSTVPDRMRLRAGLYNALLKIALLLRHGSA